MKHVLLLLCLGILAGCASTSSYINPPDFPPSCEKAVVQVATSGQAAEQAAPLLAEPGMLSHWPRIDIAAAHSLEYVRRFSPTAPACLLPPGSELAGILPIWASDTAPRNLARPVPGTGIQGSHYITYGMLATTLAHLRQLLPHMAKDPSLLAREFLWLRIGPDFRFTGYYEPLIRASHTRSARFSVPLYRTPAEPNEQRLSRHAIESGQALAGKGYELAWIEDPVDAFFLQIQGSGCLEFQNGQRVPILYDSQNGHPYKALGAVMVDRGLLARNEVSLFSIRETIKKHPELRTSLLESNPSFVFFKLGQAEKTGVNGSIGCRLTPLVSSAIDPRSLPYGSLLFVKVVIPDKATGMKNKPMRSLILPQDTGGAIKRHRMDLFQGTGTDAEYVAGMLNQKGAVYILLARKALLKTE